MNWEKIKTEYVTTDISLRSLAKKHKLTYSNLSKKCVKEKWVEARSQHRDKIASQIESKAVQKAVNYKDALYSLAFKVASQLGELTDKYSIEELTAMGIKPREITGAVRDIGDMLHIKSEADLREQEARIKKLQKEAEQHEESKDIVVTIKGGIEDYAE